MQSVIGSLAELGVAAGKFLESRPQGAVVGLLGDLGAGKTTFVRAFIEAVAKRSGVKAPRVTSPSFVLHQSYASLAPPVDHFDLYRLKSADTAALLELGYFETVEKSREKRGFVFIEWPEREARAGLLELDLRLELTITGPTSRGLHFVA